MQLPMLPADKANHFVYGAAIALIVMALAGHFGAAPLMARTLGAAVAGLAGIAKEAADYLANRRAAAAGLPPSHGVEFADFAATLGGGVFVWLAVTAGA